MTHVDKSSPSGRHLRYFCHACSAIYRTLPLRSLDDCPVPDELFQSNILDPQDTRLTQTLTRQDFDYWLRQLPRDKSPGDDELIYEMWQEEPAEMKDALYQVVNQVVQNGTIIIDHPLGFPYKQRYLSEWKDANIMGGGSQHTHPKEGWRGKNLKNQYVRSAS